MATTWYYKKKVGNQCHDIPTLYSIKHIDIMPQYWYENYKDSVNLQSSFNQQAAVSSMYAGRLSPDGIISIGYIPRKKVLKADKEYEFNIPKFKCLKRKHWHYEDGIVTEHVAIPNAQSSLGLSSVSNHHSSPKTRYGSRGITSLGRKRVRQGTYLLEYKYKKNLGFYTLTCPYVEPLLIASFNEQIAEIQRVYFQRLKRTYERLGLVWSYTSVIEVQCKRFERSGEFVLHIHYISPCYFPGTKNWILSADDLRQVWYDTLSCIVGGDPDVAASVDAALIKRSGVGYISKYMSKGSSECRLVSEYVPEQVPCQWWSMSQNIRKSVRDSTVCLPPAICMYYMQGNGCNPDDILPYTYSRYIYVSINGQETCVGISCRLSLDIATMLRPAGLIEKVCKEI